MSDVIKLDSRRPSPWNPDAGCPCAACYVRQMGKDLDDRLRVVDDLISLEANDAMRHYLDQLGELCGVECQYTRSPADDRLPTRGRCRWSTPSPGSTRRQGFNSMPPTSQGSHNRRDGGTTSTGCAECGAGLPSCKTKRWLTGKACCDGCSHRPQELNRGHLQGEAVSHLTR